MSARGVLADGDDGALDHRAGKGGRSLEKTVEAVGRVNWKELVAVGAQVSGQVKRLHVVLGQRVQAGDLIAEVDRNSAAHWPCAAPLKHPPTHCAHSMPPARPAMRRPVACLIASHSWWHRSWSRGEGFEAARVARDAARSRWLHRRRSIKQ